MSTETPRSYSPDRSLERDWEHAHHRPSSLLWQRLLARPGFTLLTAATDASMAALAVVVAMVWIRSATSLQDHGGSVAWLFPVLVFAACWSRGLYRGKLRASFLDEVGPVVGATSIAAMGLLSVALLADASEKPGSITVRVWIPALVLLSLGRFFLALAQRQARARCRVNKRTLIVGGGFIGSHVARRLNEHPEYGLRPVGFLDADPVPAFLHDHGPPILGDPEDVAEVVALYGIEQVIVAFSSESDRHLLGVVRGCHALGVEVSIVPRMFDAINERTALEHLGGLPVLAFKRVDPSGWQFKVKHLIDRMVAGLALLGLSPLFAILAAAVRFSSPGPILFRQRRVGRDGQPFDLLKFRSMQAPKADTAGQFELRPGRAPGGVEGEDRRTWIGTFMRRTSLDELPQFINVLKGEMSLVGPRPERPEFVELFEQEIVRYGERHRVKAGITGWAQVHGLRGQTSIADRAEWDNFYIENWSVRLDLKILALTALALFRRSEQT